MFTGIVQGLGRVVGLDRDDAVWTFRIQLPNVEGLNIGASVAINGTCLTATAIKGDEVAFDVISETLERTNLGALEEGHEVNVERSLRMGDELGGHLLSGHIMAVAEIIERLYFMRAVIGFVIYIKLTIMELTIRIIIVCRTLVRQLVLAIDVLNSQRI